MSGIDTNVLLQSVGYLFFVFFIFFGQRLQLMQMLGNIARKMTKLAVLRDTSYRNLLAHIAKHNANLSSEQTVRLGNLITSIAIPPVSNLDTNGLVPKMKSTFKTYEKYMKNNLKRIVGDVSQTDLENVTNSLEVAVELDIIYRVVDHFYRLGKKGDLMMVMMLNMAMRGIMEMADAMFTASAHFQSGLPIGDGFGPMVASKFGGDQNAIFSDSETITRYLELEGRKVYTVKAKGPGGSVGNPATSVSKLVQTVKPNLVVTVDAALRMESEKTGDIAEGVGTAMGGNGTERFEIEEATVGIPVLTVVCKMTLKEAISMMPAIVLNQVQPVVERVKQLIRENSESGETVVMIGVGNTMGVE